MPNTPDLDKRREILFAEEPENQVMQACLLLESLPNCTVERDSKPNSLWVSYNLHHHTLESLEKRLSDEGFKLDHGVLHQVCRQVIYYCEDTCCHNLDIPEHNTKQVARAVFAEVYSHQPHGDRDDTPPEARHYK